MTLQGDDAAAQVAATGMAGTEPAATKAKKKPGPMSRFVRGCWRILFGFPRVTIEAVLMVASLLVGLFILPSLSTPNTNAPAALQQIVLDRPADIPAYVLLDDYSGSSNNDYFPRRETVVVGMDVPKGVTAHFQLLFVYNSQDSLTNVQPSNGISLAGHLSSSDLGESGFRGVVYSGTMAGGSHSYSEFLDGYYQRYSESFKFTSGGGNNLPTDDAGINFSVSGPVQISTVSGANVTVSLPLLSHKDETTTKNETTAPLNTEVFYDGANYEAVTGGSTIQGGHYWDWFSTTGFFPPTTATGLDAVEQANEQNKTFIAAAMFGLSAAAVAALCIELVEAVASIREGRRRPENDEDDPVLV